MLVKIECQIDFILDLFAKVFSTNNKTSMVAWYIYCMIFIILENKQNSQKTKEGKEKEEWQKE